MHHTDINQLQQQSKFSDDLCCKLLHWLWEYRYRYSRYT